MLESFVLRHGRSTTAVLDFQRGLSDLPALLFAADQVVAGDSNVVEEENALVVAGEQVHALLVKAFAWERDHEIAQVPVSGSVGVCHHRAKQKVGLALAADPNLLTGDEPVIAVSDCSGLKGSKVGACVRLGEVLECDFLRAQQRF